MLLTSPWLQNHGAPTVFAEAAPSLTHPIVEICTSTKLLSKPVQRGPPTSCHLCRHVPQASTTYEICQNIKLRLSGQQGRPCQKLFCCKCISKYRNFSSHMCPACLKQCPCSNCHRTAKNKEAALSNKTTVVGTDGPSSVALASNLAREPVVTTIDTGSSDEEMSDTLQAASVLAEIVLSPANQSRQLISSHMPTLPLVPIQVPVQTLNDAPSSEFVMGMLHGWSKTIQNVDEQCGRWAADIHTVMTNLRSSFLEVEAIRKDIESRYALAGSNGVPVKLPMLLESMEAGYRVAHFYKQLKTGIPECVHRFLVHANHARSLMATGAAQAEIMSWVLTRNQKDVTATMPLIDASDIGLQHRHMAVLKQSAAAKVAVQQLQLGCT